MLSLVVVHRATCSMKKLLGIRIDTCTTACISGRMSDFITPVKNVNLKGVGGSLPVVGKGTLVITIKDGNKELRKIKDINAYFCPRLKLQLFSLQQWSLQGPIAPNGAWIRKSITDGRCTKLTMATGTKTVQYDTKTGLPIMYTIPAEDFRSYALSFAARIDPR